ncbi:hypothetical protein [Sneathiella glossodoripedis]|uniref:hypothetical protein n=1 Tax=Sneathiella glossodoripedis TaxID=418853 RepID=UPI000472F50A|nr:hypothetical protein [Sneathiella glossodoripedis]
MNMLVIFELVLAASSAGALMLMRRTYFPMNLVWAFGVTTIGVAAVLGAFVYGGFSGLKGYHNLATDFAGSVGLISFALAAVGGIFAHQFHQAGWWITLIAVVVLSVALLGDAWRAPREVQYAMVGILVLCALVRLFGNPASGLFLMGGVILLVAASLASEWVASQFGWPRVNVYHALLAASVISFGLFAARE